MTSRDFCYWLQGLFELGNPTSLNEQQTEIIKTHLNMVFAYDLDKTVPPAISTKLDEIHTTPAPTATTIFPGGKSPGILDGVWNPGNSGVTLRC